jgi:hypothetical protein
MSPGQTAPRTKTFGLRIRAWWVMREVTSFTLAELLAVVASGKEADAASNLGHYLRALTRAGILSQTGRDKPTSPTDNGAKRWRLLKAHNTGPKAPVHRASRNEVYDPNTGTANPLGEVTP